MKIAVLGAGHLGRIHLDIIMRITEYNLVGFYDPDPNLSSKISKEFSVRSFESMSSLIDATDIVDIVTPTLSHFECARQAILNHKHVFIEKPVTNTVEEADESAVRINRLHEVIKGKDEITGDIYDALDHEQLLWVHACLQLSSIYFYEQTVKKLTQEEKDKYHKENMLSAKLVLIDTDKMPQTHNELKDWVIKKSKTKDYLLMTDVARDVGDIISGGPVPKHIKPIWPFISFTAFNTLPDEFKEIYGIKSSIIKSVILKFNLTLLKITRPFLPPFFRLIPPARWAKQRITKNPSLKFNDKAQI